MQWRASNNLQQVLFVRLDSWKAGSRQRHGADNELRAASGKRRAATVSGWRRGTAGRRRWADYQSLSNGMVLLVQLGCLRQQWLTVGIYADVFDVCEDIAGETAIKLTHAEIGIIRRYGTDKSLFYEKLRCDISDI